MNTKFPHAYLAHRQRGGTFLGLVIGVLLGLGAALAVALYVSKVPVPFMNKAASKNTVDQDAQEAQKNKNWDPNEPLYNKTQPKAAASGTVGTATTPSAAVSASPTSVVSKPAPAPSVGKTTSTSALSTPTAAATKAASADPLGDLAKAKSAASSTTVAALSPTAGAELFAYFIQAGAFRSNEDAQAQKAKLAMAGFEASITEREQSGRTVYRVRVGPLNKQADADKTKEKLDGAGFETAMVRVQR